MVDVDERSKSERLMSGKIHKPIVGTHLNCLMESELFTGDTREMAYNTLVRAQLEYTVVVWDPYTKDKTCQIE